MSLEIKLVNNVETPKCFFELNNCFHSSWSTKIKVHVTGRDSETVICLCVYTRRLWWRF